MVRLFGPLRVEGIETQAKFRTKKTGHVVALLCIRPTSSFKRDTLATALWPDHSLSAARQSLRMALTDIRQVLGEESIIGDRDWIQINEAIVGSDASLFESLVTQSKGLEEALDLVSGRFLEDVEDSWALPERYRFEDLIADATIEFMKECEIGNKHSAGIKTGKRTLAILGLREEIHIGLMRLYSEQGLNSAVISQFEELEKALDDLWGEKPSQAAIDLLEATPRSESKQKTVSNNIPNNLRPLVGRADLLQAITDELMADEGPTLLTLIGPGGTGKTSLAISVAKRLTNGHQMAVWFAELATSNSLEETIQAISNSLGLPHLSSEESAVAVSRELASHQGLMVLDNFEQLPAECAAWISKTAKLAPGIRFLVTSRSPLKIPSEKLLLVPPLDLPLGSKSLEEVRQISAIKMFEQEAKTVNPRFSITPNNVGAVIELCRSLDALPLAIELAASRMVSQTPGQALADLQHSTFTLESPINRPAGRHNSLRLTIDWSYRLLSLPAQELLLRLSVLDGKISDQAATALMPIVSTKPILQELVQASLLNIDVENDHSTYWMLETIHSFAQEKLKESNFYEELKRDFVSYCVAYADEIKATPTEGTAGWLNSLRAFSTNMAVAVRFTLELEGMESEMASLYVHLSNLSYMPQVIKSVVSFAPEILERARQKLPSTMVARVCLAAFFMQSNREDPEKTIAVVNEGLSLAREDLALHNSLRLRKGHLLIKMHRFFDAQKELQEALDACPLTDLNQRSRLYFYLSLAYTSEGRFDQSLDLLTSALTAARRIDVPVILGYILTDLSIELGRIGRLEEAFVLLEEAFEISKSLFSIRAEALNWSAHGQVLLSSSQYNNAAKSLMKSIDLHHEIEHTVDLPKNLIFACMALRQCGASKPAAECLGKAFKIAEEPGRSLNPCLKGLAESEVKALESLLGSFQFEKHLVVGEKSEWRDLFGRANLSL